MKILRKLKNKLYFLKLMLKYTSKNINTTKLLSFNKDSQIHISVTSYGSKLKRVFITLESIVEQTESYSSLTLYLSRQDIDEQKLPSSLLRLQKRGLKIYFVEENLKSYKKLYYSYLLHKDNSDALLVTADDDVMYKNDWLEKLVSKHKSQENAVICHRGKRISLNSDYSVKPYNEWRAGVTDIKEEVLLMPTGVSGVLYPINSLKGLDEQLDDFVANAPHADDIWFKCLTISNNYGSYLATEGIINYPSILECNTKRRGLTLINVHQGGNDKQIIKVLKYFSINFKNFVSHSNVNN